MLDIRCNTIEEQKKKNQTLIEATKNMTEREKQTYLTKLATKALRDSGMKGASGKRSPKIVPMDEETLDLFEKKDKLF